MAKTNKVNRTRHLSPGEEGGIQHAAYYKKGRLHLLDDIEHGDPRAGSGVKLYSESVNNSRNSLHWQRAVRWIENVLFSSGRHYVEDVLLHRISNSSQDSVGDLSVIQNNFVNQLPKPTNDLLGRYIESNISLLTENRPIPRVTSKSDRAEDIEAAELSQFLLEYTWEALSLPQKHREIARILLHTGICWLEVCYDPAAPKLVRSPKQEKSSASVVPSVGGPSVPTPVERMNPVRDEQGNIIYEDKMEYGDIVANIVTPFEMHMPTTHFWNGEDMGWIMREQFISIEAIKDKYGSLPRNKGGFSKKNGWYLDRLEDISSEAVENFPMWWWERVSELVEGPGPSLYIGSPDNWDGYTTLRIFDRKPNPQWPKGRTIISAGDVVLYDSPKEVGARAYDSRWPDRWHPYVRFRWEGQMGSVYGRSLLSKLLPKIKRVNSIDANAIMYRRTAPYNVWTAPKGAHMIENMWTGIHAQIYEYDSKQTLTHKPEPVFPPPFPAALLEERQINIAEMEAIAGTEQILRGERPVGVNSAAMIDILRKQALASRSPILQEWDEGLQLEGAYILQENIKHTKHDSHIAERIRILAREKYSELTIAEFSGSDLSDNVQVRVDTAQMAFVSQEAREAKMLQTLQYIGNLSQVDDPALRQAILDELGIKREIQPSGADAQRARKMISLIKQKRFDHPQLIPLEEDDPYTVRSILVRELKGDSWFQMDAEQQQKHLDLMKAYKMMIEARELQIMQMQAMVAQQQQEPQQ